MVGQEIKEKSALELSLAEGTRRLSAKTGWVHSEDREIIPLFDNGCFTLALFRSKNVSSFQEGLKRLERLLAFQAPNGGFPASLHAYPHGQQERAFELRFLTLLFWMKKQVGPFMPLKLQEELNQATMQLSLYCRRLNEISPFPRGLDQLLAALMARLDPEGEWTPDWDELPHASSELGDWLLGAQVAGEEAKAFPQALTYWNRALALYSGSAVAEFCEGHFPSRTLFHLFMADRCKSYPSDLIRPHPIHITGALIFPFEIKGGDEAVQEEESMLACAELFDPHQKIVRLCGMKGKELKVSRGGKGLHLIRYCWKDKEEVHSLVCQEQRHLFKRIGDQVFSFTYKEEIPTDKWNVELSFFVDNHPNVSIWVNQTRATLFKLEEIVWVRTPHKAIGLSFSIIEGEGTFCGHISRGNRPAQCIDTFGLAADWRIDLRTVRRTEHLKLKLSML